MILENYYQKNQNNIEITRQQASDFAKNIAGDFNPLHDIDAKRFCVPGDLLFALVLNQYGLSQHMEFKFGGMVTDLVTLQFPSSNADSISIQSTKDKEYLNVSREGEISSNTALTSNLTQNYVTFSGQTFLKVLVPLMAEQNVMINPDRPLIIYESMGIELHTLDIQNPQLELVKATLKTAGKRGDVLLRYRLLENGKEVGCGKKTMVISGLRPYEKEVMDGIVDLYEQRKQTLG